MPTLSKQSELRRVRDLPFCHLCGRRFKADDRTDHDHVPPRACFDKVDRNPTLKLKAHVCCNNSNKLHDEKVGELIAVERRQSVSGVNRLHISLFQELRTGFFVGAAHNLDLIGCIRRWVGGFHAALYLEPLSPRAFFQITPPVPLAQIAAAIQVEAIPAHLAKFVQTLKLNRAARNVDRVVSNNGKLKYESVWAQDDRRSHWLCIWALDVYGWAGLGDKRFGPRGCWRLSSGHWPTAYWCIESDGP